MAYAYAIILVFATQISLAQFVDTCSSANFVNSPGTVISNTACATYPYNITAAAFTNSTNPTELAPAPCSMIPNRDGWFKFTTDSSASQITLTATSNRGFGVEVYSGTCGALVPVPTACGVATSAPLSITHTFSVSAASTYYVRIYTAYTGTGNTSGTICVYQSGSLFPDNCATASPLTVNTTVTCGTSTSGTTIGTTASATPVCAGNADDDVWYKFTATAASHIVTVTPTGLTNAVFQVFSGNCSALTSIGCINDTGGANIETALFSGLTIGNTYYVRVYSQANGSGQGTFNLCVTTTGTSSYCSSTTSNPNTVFIKNFLTTGGVANISNGPNSGSSSTGYSNFTFMSVTQYATGTVSFSADLNGGVDDAGINVWVDWNNDNDFNDSGEKVYSSGAYVFNASGSFLVPLTATVGNHRMRVRADYFSTDPSACGSISFGETEDYTLTVLTLPCSSVVSNVTISAIGTTTATYSWTAPGSPPASGYQYYQSTSSTNPTLSTTATGTTSAGTTTTGVTGLAPSTTYYVWVRTNCGGGTGTGAWVGPSSFTTAMPATGVTICAGGSGNLTASGTCTAIANIGTTITGSWNAGTDPVAFRITTSMENSATCGFATYTSNYSRRTFQVSTTGSYTFWMTANTNYDGMGYIVADPFTPGTCGSGTWVVGDDDSGVSSLEPQMTATLTAGITYSLISTIYSTSDTTITDTFQWNVSGPGTIIATTTGTIQWYTAASGGILLGTGSSFNPVGVTNSGLANTNTPGTTTYYVACSGNASVRTPVNFVITGGPTSAISGSGSICAGNTTISISLSGTAPWSLTYANNIGDAPVTLTNIMTPTLTIPVAPAVAANYTVTALGDAGCTAGIRTGTATFTASVWNGATTSWSVPGNWSTAAVPTNSDCVIIPSAPNFATITASDTGYAQHLIIRNGGRLEVTNARTITVTNKVTVDAGGTFNIEDGASLVQIDNVANSGVINMKRNTLLRLYDYTYWNSPVTFASGFTLGALSPGTPADKFFSWTPSIGGNNGNWAPQLPSAVMNPNKGYIVRAPTGTPINVSLLNTMTFTGVPNNGDLTAPIGFGTIAGDNDQWNLIGNPYPSAISVSSFLANPTNDALLDNTVYFWTHNSQPSTANADPFYGNFYSNYSASDYASCNNLGGTAACATCPIPNGFVGAGQAFFIKSEAVAGSAQFNNSMRVALNNTQFFRNSDIVSTDYSQYFEKHRIWLNLTNNTNVFNQILVGYAEGATLGYDSGLDGSRFSASSTTFYSVIDGNQLGIQGRPLPFDTDDQVTLGYKATTAGELSIGIDHFDEMFENVNIYLEDLLLNAIHDLKSSPYVFATASGTFDARFVLRYSTETLSVNSPGSKHLTAFINNNTLNIRTSSAIEDVQIFDLGGKLLGTFNPQNDELTQAWPFTFAQGSYLAKIKMQDGTVETRKLLN
jgi:hypothetical protein